MTIQTTREFCPANRYVYDFGPCSIQRGWAQIDTDQDASYYGNWCNPKTLEIFAYVEGDTTHHQCETGEEFAAEIRSMNEWHISQGYRPVQIDPGLSPDMQAAFDALGLRDLTGADAA
jgi:hypothetical protein